MKPVKILLGGALGRMGMEMRRYLEETKAGEIVAGVDVQAGGGSPFPCYAGYDEVPADVGADVLIDFSHPTALDALLRFAVNRGMPCVLCATGYTAEQNAAIDGAARKLPVLQSANMSLGINLMALLCEMAARTLPDFDVEIVEKHHRRKKDSPSGTALMLRDAVAGVSPKRTVCGREGQVGPRADDEIGVLSVRGGTVTGEHEVGFYGEGQQLIITHRAENRALFAAGAVTAAEFLLSGREPGRYSMRDVVQKALK